MNNLKRTKLAFVFALVTTAVVFGQMPASDPNGNWELMPEMSDEFSGSLDLNKWDNNIADWGDWSWEPENAWNSNGKHIQRMKYEPHQRNGVTKYYTSGMIRSKAEPILYGYFEAKMKGATRFPGVCPAFWLYTQTASLWTEIDIMEMQENFWNVHKLDMNTHTFEPVERHEKRYWEAPWDPADDFHVYGCKWDENGITWYIDGVQRAYRENEHWHQALDVAISMGLREPLKTTAESSGFPTTFETDYVRVWIPGTNSTYALTVNNGSGDGNYTAGANINITADDAPAGQIFDKWTGDVSAVADVNSANTTLTMPSSGVSVTATYKVAACNNTEATIQAENWTAMSGVQTETTSDVGGGENVGWNGSGDWLEYCIDIPSDGNYIVELRVAAREAGSQVQISLDGVNKTTKILPQTSAWQTWETVETDAFSAASGTKTLRLTTINAAYNINWLVVKEATQTEYSLIINNGSGDGNYTAGTVVNISADAVPSGQVFDKWTGDVSAVADVNSANTSVTMPSSNVSITASYSTESTCNNTETTIQAEDWSAMLGVQTETTSDVGGGENVGWNGPGDWLEYCINIPENGSYVVELRVAARDAGSQVQIALDGVNKTTKSLPHTGAWQTWETIETDAFSASVGNQTLRITTQNTAYNLNWLIVKQAAPIEYALTVNSGSGDGNYTAGTQVNISADAAPSGQEFDMWTGDVSAVADVNSVSTSLTMPATATVVTATYKNSSTPTDPVTVTLNTIQDSYLQNGSNNNLSIIRIEQNRRVGYLMFDLSSVSGTITNAQLKMTCNGDAGNGNINVNLGSSNNWTETNLSSSNAPVAGTLLGSLNSTYSIGTTYTWDLDGSTMPAGGNVSLVVAATGGNDVAFASKENSVTDPQLVITYDPTKAAEENFDNLVKQDARLALYPNPASNELFYNYSLKPEKDAVFIIYNSNGNIMQQNNLKADNSIDISNLRPGIYVAVINNSGIITASRFIKQ